MTKPAPLLLTPAEMQLVTGGRWRHLPADGGLRPTGINFFLPRVKPGDLFFCNETEETAVRRFVEKAFRRGAVAALVRQGTLDDGRYAVLEVADPDKALQDMALASSLKFDGTRVLVTGSHGKTAFKTQLHHLIRGQISVSAYLGSANKKIPVYRALVDIATDSRVVIVEVAVPGRGVGEERAFFVRPDYCVITGIAPEHLKSHKSMDRLIRNKAGVVRGLRPGGCCLLPADDPHFAALAHAVREAAACEIFTFGSTAECDGRLLAADFSGRRWHVRAEILGEPIEYDLPLLERYAPLTSVGVLLQARLLGADLARCVPAYGDYRNYRSSGNLYRVPCGSGSFLLYDQSVRAELKGFESMFELMSRLRPEGDGRKIVVMSEFFDIADNPGVQVDYERMRAAMEQAGIDILYTIGDFKQHGEALPPAVNWRLHGAGTEDVFEDVLATVRADDMVFLRADPPAGLDRLADALRAVGGDAVECLY